MSREYDFAKKVLFTQEELQNRMRGIARKMADDYSEKGLVHMDNPLVVVCVLKGSFLFAADLTRMLGDLKVPLRMEFICVSSYGESVTTSGQVRMLLDTRHSIEDKHVLIVEDIVDSALTLKYLHKVFTARKPASLKTVVMLDKPGGRQVPFAADYVVATVPHLFVVGYGLDYNEAYRELRDVVELHPRIYTKEQKREPGHELQSDLRSTL